MKGKDIYKCKSEKCINVKVNPKMYVLADFMSTEQHALCDCSYENEKIYLFIYKFIFLWYLNFYFPKCFVEIRTQ